MSDKNQVAAKAALIEQLMSKRNFEDLGNHLTELETLRVTKELLQETVVVRAVYRVLKHCPTAALKKKAKCLLSKWKALYKDAQVKAKGSPKLSPAGRQKEEHQRLSPNPSQDAARGSSSSHSPQPSQDVAGAPEMNMPENSPGAGEPEAAHLRAGDPKSTDQSSGELRDPTRPVRAKCTELLYEALAAFSTEQPRADLWHRFAQEIEECIFTLHAKNLKKYKTCIRSKIANLKNPRNSHLRENLLSGIMSPRAFAEMTVMDMASKELKQLRASYTESCIQEHSLPQGVEGTPTKKVRCRRCEKFNCQVTVIARGALFLPSWVRNAKPDEELMTYVICKECGEQWYHSKSSKYKSLRIEGCLAQTWHSGSPPELSTTARGGRLRGAGGEEMRQTPDQASGPTKRREAPSYNRQAEWVRAGRRRPRGPASFEPPPPSVPDPANQALPGLPGPRLSFTGFPRPAPAPPIRPGPAPARRHVVPSVLDQSNRSRTWAVQPRWPVRLVVDRLCFLITPGRGGSELPGVLRVAARNSLHCFDEPGRVVNALPAGRVPVNLPAALEFPFCLGCPEGSFTTFCAAFALAQLFLCHIRVLKSKILRFIMAGKSSLFKVILLGDGGVGKSSLMNRYVTNKFDTQLFHTIGVEFLNKDLEVDGHFVTMQIWDTAGQERFRSLRTPFYRGSDCCLLTFSVDDSQSFQNLSNWKKEFIYYADVKEPESFPFVILGNKIDISERQVSAEEAQAWCRDNGDYPYFETSAKDATNVAAAFEEAVRRVLATEDRADHLIQTDTVSLHRKPKPSSSCC